MGKDGETHQGIFDIAYLSSMPNMTVLSPMDGEELVEALNYGIAYQDGPIAVRYPRGRAFLQERKEKKPFERGRAEVLAQGDQVLFLAVGNMVETALQAAKMLDRQQIHATVVNMRFVKPWDETLVAELAPQHKLIVTMEDHVYQGGFSQMVQAFLQRKEICVPCVHINWPDRFIEHGTVQQLYERYGMTAEAVAGKVSEELQN